MSVVHNIYRYKLSESIIELIKEFTDIHKYDDRKTYKEAWLQYCKENEEVISREENRLIETGYKGNVMDKMFKSGRYYYIKKKNNKMNENKIINLTNELYDVSQLENTKLFVSKLVNYIESTLTQFESSKDEPGMEVNADNFHQLREILYEVLIYNIPVFEVVYALLKEMMNLMTHEQSNVLMKNTYIFFRLYNNNYRPIFHLEKFVLDIISILTQHDTI